VTISIVCRFSGKYVCQAIPHCRNSPLSHEVQTFHRHWASCSVIRIKTMALHGLDPTVIWIRVKTTFWWIVLVCVFCTFYLMDKLLDFISAIWDVQLANIRIWYLIAIWAFKAQPCIPICSPTIHPLWIVVQIPSASWKIIIAEVVVLVGNAFISRRIRILTHGQINDHKYNCCKEYLPHYLFLV